MGITFNTNLAALGAQRNIGIASNAASSSLSKLSSGSRIPQAKDDAAGLAIGSKLKSEVTGLTQASNNAAQAISLLQIADGALSSIGDMLQRMKALAVQSSSGQLADADRSLLNQEFTSLRSEVDRVATLTNFNGTSLLAGSTVVGSNVNDLVSYSANNATSATNLIGDGFETIKFSQSFGDGVIKIGYDSATRVLSATNMLTGDKQDVTISATTLTTGQTETYNFGDIGVELTINSQFAKGTSINALNAASTNVVNTITATTAATAGTIAFTNQTAGAVTSVTVNNFNLGGTGANAIDQNAISGAIIISNATDMTDVDLGNLVINGHTFSTGATSISWATTGNKTYSYSDGNGNSFDVVVAVGTGYTQSAGAATVSAGTISVNSGGTQTAFTVTNAVTGTTGALGNVMVDNVSFTGTGANKFSASDLVGVFTVTGNGDEATVSDVTINGHTFTAGSNTVDLTGVGGKYLTLTDNQGNSFDLVFDVNTAYTTAAMGGTVTIAAGTTGARVEATGSSDNDSRPRIVDINFGATPTNYGAIHNAALNVTNVSGTAAATMNIAGTTFSTASTGGSITALGSTGTKTAVLTDGAGNSITVAFNVTQAFASGDSAQLVLGEVGQLVAADSVTSGSTAFDFKVGTGVTSNDSISFTLNSATTTSLGINSSRIDTATFANAAISAVNAAITAVSSRRADIGAAQSRLDFASTSINVAIENTTAAQSALLDVDVSSEITKFTNQNVLMQAGISLLGQANQQPALLLRLLQ